MSDIPLHGNRHRLRIERELKALIDRHTHPDGTDRHGNQRTAYYMVAVPELQNILNPGSAPMYPTDQGHAATCSTCCPKGNGAKWGKPWPLKTKESQR